MGALQPWPHWLVLVALGVMVPAGIVLAALIVFAPAFALPYMILYGVLAGLLIGNYRTHRSGR